MPYLSVAEYIRRFGERETILLTNTTAAEPGVTPTYDSLKVEEAINDATEVVEAYVGKRYAVPIEDPPRVLIGWVAALAREDLHVKTNKVTAPVQDAADRIRSQLRDVAKGEMTLPLDEGQVGPVQNGQGYARSSNDRPAATFSGGGALDAFTAPFSGGYAPACWRGGR